MKIYQVRTEHKDDNVGRVVLLAARDCGHAERKALSIVRRHRFVTQKGWYVDEMECLGRLET